MVRLSEGSLTKPQEDEVGGVRSRNIPDFCSPPLSGCRSHPSRPPILAQSLPPMGGRLSTFSAEWTKIGASKWVLRTLLEGYSLPFSSLPPLTSPVFTAVTAPVVAYAHLNGVCLHIYLDDWLLNPISEELTKQQTQWLLDLCTRLGCVVNVEKSSLTHSQVAIYLGISLDTRVGLTYPSERRIKRWLSISGDFLARQTQPALLWLRLLGHLEKLVPYCRLRIRPNQFQLCSGWSQTRDHPLIQVNLDQGTRDSILWWRTHSSLHKGIPLGSPLIEVFLFTDSSAVGWGAHMDRRTASGRWSEAMKELHINVLELNAIWLGLQAFEDILQDSNVAIMCDNVSAIAYLRNQGGTRSQQMCRMAIDTCEWAEKRSMTLIPRHLPGHLNVLADHLSCRDQFLKTECSLNPAVARRLFRVWGSPHVDLFALKCNTQLATYMSPIPEPEAWKVDSLVQSWEGLYAYAYPPTTLIRQTLNELILHRAELILIAPLWPKQEWFPDLLRLSIAFPLVLPPTAKLLKQSFSQQILLSLHAWRLSVDPIKLEECPTGSLFLKENPLLTSMNRSGIPLENGVSLTELIHTRLLSP